MFQKCNKIFMILMSLAIVFFIPQISSAGTRMDSGLVLTAAAGGSAGAGGAGAGASGTTGRATGKTGSTETGKETGAIGREAERSTTQGEPSEPAVPQERTSGESVEPGETIQGQPLERFEQPGESTNEQNGGTFTMPGEVITPAPSIEPGAPTVQPGAPGRQPPVPFVQPPLPFVQPPVPGQLNEPPFGGTGGAAQEQGEGAFDEPIERFEQPVMPGEEIGEPDLVVPDKETGEDMERGIQRPRERFQIPIAPGERFPAGQ